VIVDQDRAYYAPALPVKVKSTVGAGDSMVAALCLALEEGRYRLMRCLEWPWLQLTASSVMAEGTKPMQQG
jgi:fructose-1-phosphate kinase PfkB-like protein